MMVRVRVFASLRERIGRPELDWTLADDATVGDLWQAVCAAHPALADTGASVSFAVNQEYVARHHRLHPGDEVALIPPVSGG